jgi:hypothetical protein
MNILHRLFTHDGWVTEGDKDTALYNYMQAYRNYQIGLESWGVVAEYEEAARRAGATDAQFESVRELVALMTKFVYDE